MADYEGELTSEELEEHVSKVGNNFRSFGGGKGSDWNPVAAALKDNPLQFAAGVDVSDVVDFVLKEIGK